jgi:glycosyltransferase involved in cell wall biosynthesis
MAVQLISIVLPVYNQADHVARVVRAYLHAFERVPISVEWILVPNGCRDASVSVCKELVTELPGVRCEESQRTGWGAAVLHGLANAKGDLLCYTNLARTAPADLVLVTLYGIANPGVVVKANRKIRESAFRRLGSLLYNLECRSLFNLSYWDINGTPKVFPREMQGLMSLTKTDDLIDLEFNVMCRERDYPVLEVPILSSTRHGGASTTRLGSAFRMYKGALDMAREHKRGKTIS